MVAPKVFSLLVHRFELTELAFSLYSMRVLPNGVFIFFFDSLIVSGVRYDRLSSPILRILQFPLISSKRGPKILLDTFLSKIKILFCSAFRNVQFSHYHWTDESAIQL